MMTLQLVQTFLAKHGKRLCIVLLAVMTVFAFLNAFIGLGTQRINDWDESRHGVSACEMIDHGDYLVNTYDGIPDYRNAKPVFSFYGNIAGILLFGKNIFAFRLCSALCYLLIAVFMFLFLKKEAGLAAAFFGTGVFLVNPTNWFHCFQTGDPDALFLLFCFLAFAFLWQSRENGWKLVPSALFLSFAFLTKSFHVAGLGLVTLIFIAFHLKKYQWRQLAAAFLTGIVPVLIWAACRYHADGLTFFQNMLERDLLGRVSTEMHYCEHDASPWYYYLDLINYNMVVIPLGIMAAAIAAGLCLKGKQWMPENLKPLFFWTAGTSCFLFVMFSFCSVKLEWYVWSSVLFFSVAAGIVCQGTASWLEKTEPLSWKNRVLPYAALVVMIGMSVWICVGEGKAFRENLNKRHMQQDVFGFLQGGDAYRNQTFYSVRDDGCEEPPRQRILLLIRFLDGNVLIKDVKTFQQDTQTRYLICYFEGSDRDNLLQKAQEFAEKHTLKLISAADDHALYQKKP